MSSLSEQFARLNQHLQQLAQQNQDDCPQLIAVSKRQSVNAIRELYAAGQRAFAENQVQEARQKQEQLQGLAIEWHFIGPIQSNKTRAIASTFDWVHSLDRFKIARRLAEQRPIELAPLNACIQVNIDVEASKSGVTPEACAALCLQVSVLPGIRLRGLMCIPRKTADPAQQLDSFQRMADLQAEIQQKLPQLDTLSMGMSDDYAAAIAAGSTMVRIGSRLFGERN